MNTLAVVAGLSKTGGGTSYSVPLWSNFLAHLKVQRFLLTIRKKNEPMSDFVEENIVRLVVLESLSLGGWNTDWSPRLGTAIQQICQESHIDLLHGHGVWLPANHTCSKIARDLRLPLVITPHGMLTQWSFHHKHLKKRLAWKIYQKRDLESARVVHVTAMSEGDDLRVLGYKGPLAIISNGVDIPEWKEQPRIQKEIRTALFVSRIHPKKGLLNLVDAWSRVKPKDWRMVVAGPDEGGYSVVVQRAIREKGLEDVFSLQGPVFGEDLKELYRRADLFILPTFNENFGIAVAEALAFGIPVITTQGTPWGELVEKDCGWWVPVGVEPLIPALKQATESSMERLREMGKRGRKLVEERYTWPVVAQRMKTLYEWVLGGGATPIFVRTD